MVFAGLNYLAILLAALAAFGWGAIYYMTLSKQWLAAVGISKEQMQAGASASPFVISFVALIVMSWVLAGTVGHLGPGQVTLKNGIISGLFLWLAAAGRDEAAFDHPGEFDLHRTDAERHLAFGHGLHYCLGANLARLEANVALRELAGRIRGIEVDEAGAQRVHSINVRGFAHLPVTIASR